MKVQSLQGASGECGRAFRAADDLRERIRATEWRAAQEHILGAMNRL